MLNEEQFKLKWTEIKGGLRNVWGRLTDEELEMTKGSLTSIANLVERHYGESKDETRVKLKSLMASFNNPTDKGITPDESSFGRSPNEFRTTEVSQNQDIKQGIISRDGGTKKLEERSYTARKNNLGGSSYNGSANNEPTDEESTEYFNQQNSEKKGAFKSSVYKDGGEDRTSRQ
jgi:uncharacterized protein YjbJ (UPF0337 family)